LPPYRRRRGVDRQARNIDFHRGARTFPVLRSDRRPPKRHQSVAIAGISRVEAVGSTPRHADMRGSWRWRKPVESDDLFQPRRVGWPGEIGGRRIHSANIAGVTFTLSSVVFSAREIVATSNSYGFE